MGAALITTLESKKGSVMKKDLFLVIDMQNVYTEGGEWFCPNIDVATANIIKVIKRVDDSSAPADRVIFTKFIASKNPSGTWIKYNEENKAVNESAYANEIVDKLKPYVESHEVFEKAEYSSLSAKALKDTVSQYVDDGRVVVSGVVADCCVLATVMGLIDMGVKVIYLTDAVAGIDDETENAVLTVLKGLDPLHVRRMTTEEYLGNIN